MVGAIESQAIAIYLSYYQHEYGESFMTGLTGLLGAEQVKKAAEKALSEVGQKDGGWRTFVHIIKLARAGLLNLDRLALARLALFALLPVNGWFWLVLIAGV